GEDTSLVAIITATAGNAALRRKFAGRAVRGAGPGYEQPESSLNEMARNRNEERLEYETANLGSWIRNDGFRPLVRRTGRNGFCDGNGSDHESREARTQHAAVCECF